MYRSPRVFGLKSLLCMSVFCLSIHAGAVSAGGAETAAVPVATPADASAPQDTPVQAPRTEGLPAPDMMMRSLDPIPPGMSVEEFTQHMQGAHEAFLTLDDFVALRAAEPDLAILDVRSGAAYDQRHIRGAYNLPVTEMTEHTLPVLLPDRARAVVLVCDESFFPTRRLSMTLQAWPVLKANGYSRVYRLNLWRPAADGMSANGPEEIAKHVAFEGTQVPESPPASP